jgi:Kef-type K+ transport system membrane component KefB
MQKSEEKSVTKTVTSQLNNVFSNKELRMFVLVLTGIFAGYTLQRVPKWLNDMFNDSELFKFVVIFFIFVCAYYPLEEKDIMSMGAMSAGILVLFNLARQVGKE